VRSYRLCMTTGNGREATTGRATSRQPIQLDGRWNPGEKSVTTVKKHPILEHCAGRTGSTSTSITCDMTRPQRVTRSVAIIHRTVNRVHVPGPSSWTSDRFRCAGFLEDAPAVNINYKSALSDNK
jgi:hypothetical protein